MSRAESLASSHLLRGSKTMSKSDIGLVDVRRSGCAVQKSLIDGSHKVERKDHVQ
jgi:hypothetical protein